MPFDSDRFDYFASLLSGALKDLGLMLDDAKQRQLLDYLALLEKWNKAFNLTAVRDTEEMLYRHIIDSLSIVTHISGSRIMDVGTGPGLPGIVLAICYPDKSFTLVDSNIKKTRFLTQSLIELGLRNVEVHHARIEALDFEVGFDEIVSRAFASLDKMVVLCQKHLAPAGRFLAMKGLDTPEERQELPSGFDITESLQLDVPACEAQRHLIIISRKQ